MKSKNVARLFIFVFFLCFVFLSLGWSQTWIIPNHVNQMYPDHQNRIDIDDIKKGLEFKIDQIERVINRLFLVPGSSRRKYLPIAQILVRHGVVIDPESNNPKFEEGPISTVFQQAHNYNKVEIRLTEVEFFDAGNVIDDEVDILAIVKFDLVFSNTENLNKLDPPGTMTLFHRRICTWR